MRNFVGYINNPAFIFAALFTTIVTGVLVFAHMPRSRRHQLFFLFTMTVAWWLLFWGLFHSTHDIGKAKHWLRFTHMLSVPFISPTIYWFSLTWRENWKQNNIILFGFVAAAFVATLHTLYTDRIYDVVHTSWGIMCVLRYTPFGIGYYALFQGLFCIYGALTFRELYLQYRSTRSINEKQQLRYFFIALAFGYTGVFDFLAVLHFDTPPLGYISVTLFLILFAYALVRHNLLDINLTYQKFSLLAVIYSYLLGLLVPVIYVFSKRHADLWIQSPVALALSTGALMGFILSLGPWIYAYMTKKLFWMRTKSSTGLVHELKSPIGNILLASESLLLASNGESNKNDYAAIIQKNAERLDSFVRDLLHVARASDQQIQLRPSPFSLTKVIAAECEHHQPTAEKQNSELIFDASEPFEVTADQEKIRQVISNLLSNALKFTKQGRIAVAIRKTPTTLLCEVQDNGAGIPSSEIDHVFDRFFQGKHSTKGSGIGLTIAKAWVEAHGGKIWADSAGEGKGTTVTFALPVEKF